MQLHEVRVAGRNVSDEAPGGWSLLLIGCIRRNVEAPTQRANFGCAAGNIKQRHFPELINKIEVKVLSN